MSWNLCIGLSSFFSLEHNKCTLIRCIAGRHTVSMLPSSGIHQSQHLKRSAVCPLEGSKRQVDTANILTVKHQWHSGERVETQDSEIKSVTQLWWDTFMDIKNKHRHEITERAEWLTCGQEWADGTVSLIALSSGLVRTAFPYHATLLSHDLPQAGSDLTSPLCCC